MGWDGEVWVSYDNPKIHQGVTLPPRVQRVRLPPYSPDLHCVIEHVFGRVEPRLPGLCAQQAQLAPGKRVPLTAVRALIESTIREETTQAVISADARRLVITLQIVAAGEGEAFEVEHDGRTRVLCGTAGGFAPKAWR